MNLGNILRQVQGWVKIKGATDGTNIGNTGDRLHTDNSFSPGNAPLPFLFEVQKGSHSNLSYESIWGHNDALGNQEESVWHNTQS